MDFVIARSVHNLFIRVRSDSWSPHNLMYLCNKVKERVSLNLRSLYHKIMTESIEWNFFTVFHTLIFLYVSFSNQMFITSFEILYIVASSFFVKYIFPSMFTKCIHDHSTFKFEIFAVGTCVRVMFKKLVHKLLIYT